MPYAAKSFWERIRLLAKQPTWWAEVSIASSLTIWAVICALENHHLNQTSFHIIVRMAPEIFWERLALAAGAFHLLALIINGSSVWLRGHNWRAAACLVSVWFLTLLLINFFSAKVVPPGAAFYIAPLCVDLVALFKNLRRTA